MPVFRPFPMVVPLAVRLAAVDQAQLEETGNIGTTSTSQ